MSEWKEVKLGELVSVKGGKRLPKGIQLITDPNSHPYIRIRDLTGKKTLELDSSYEYVDDETQTKISRYIVNTGDILVSIVGTIGLVSIVGKSLNLANLTENCVKLVDKRNVDCEYLYYYLVSELGQNEISKGTVGAVQPKLPIKNIESIIVKLPPLPTQRRIAAILSSLDAKIENNNKVNAKLEEIAQNLFKEWFVDFGPFKDGKFVDSELGPIPEGWRVGTLGEIAEVNPSRSLKKGMLAKYLDMKNMPTSGPFPTNWEHKVYSGGAKFCNGDTLMARITPCLENGKVSYVNFLDDNEIGFGSTEYIVITSKSDFFPELFYFLCREKNFTDYAVANMNGSSGRQRVSSDSIKNYRMPIPPNNILEKLNPIKSIMVKIKYNSLENQRLATLRDTLLPKLMSGEIEV